MSWEDEARRTLEGASIEGVERLGTVGPPLFAGDGGRALLTFFFSALALTLAIARAELAEAVVDPFFMLLEVIALGLMLRTLVLGLRLGRRLGTATQVKAHAMALSSEGLVFRGPDGEVAIAADDLVDARVGAPGSSPMGSGWDEIQIVYRSGGIASLLRIPPVFGPSELVLARIHERVGRSAPIPGYVPPAPDYLPAEVYEGAARGASPESVTPIAHGWGWMRSGPYAALLFGVVFLQGLLLLPDGYAPGPLSVGGVIVCLLWPMLWLLSARRVVGPRLGLALVLTPAEVLFRVRAGFVRAPYGDITEVRVESRTGWSLLEGRQPRRFLVISRAVDDDVRYAEDFLSLPAESVAAMILAHGDGRLP